MPLSKKIKKITGGSLVSYIRANLQHPLFIFVLFLGLGAFLLVSYFVISGAGEIGSGEGNQITFNYALFEETKEMLEGYPMEAMIPYIVQQDKDVAAFLVAIAKKESNWGKHVPVLNGEDCFNYWGFRKKAERMTRDGYTCFSSPKEAVNMVARRISWLVEHEELDTPEEMVAWKCGWSCAGHSRYDVRKWIQDVNLYFQKLVN
jgi:hypothetical protein